MRLHQAALLLVLGGCASGPDHGLIMDTGLEFLSLSAVRPALIVPGTRVVVQGDSFADSAFGVSHLRLLGSVNGAPVDTRLPLEFVDFETMEAAFGNALDVGFPTDTGTFRGEATIEVESLVDGELYQSAPLSVGLELRRELQPFVDYIDVNQFIYLNQEIQLVGGGFLLGEGEGLTTATVQGCYRPDDESHCLPVGPVSVPVEPVIEFDRTRAMFVFAPSLLGTIRPGRFEGTIAVQNTHAGGSVLQDSPRSVAYHLLSSAIQYVTPTSASLGQYVDIVGSGFVGIRGGASVDELTVLTLEGVATVDSATVPVNLVLVPEFVSGERLRYAISEEDSLGQAIDLRRNTAHFEGTIGAKIIFGTEEIVGSIVPIDLDIAPIKQVVYIDFLPTYVEGLRAFGLRGTDGVIRERVLDVLQRDYQGINISFRTEPVSDFAVYSIAEVAGKDPSGKGHFGLDNTPGKDLCNRRLHDQIGGGNAVQQEDGKAGYGGVFVESLFGFSPNPGQWARPSPLGDPMFDSLFDPFRPDRGGRPVSSEDLQRGVPEFSSDGVCPAKSRPDQVVCAVNALSNLIGTTLTHEIGHSLGLSNPQDPSLGTHHNLIDVDGAIMDAGLNRSFRERAEVDGEGPAVFCEENYSYLRAILPTSGAPPSVMRPSCGPGARPVTCVAAF